MENTTTRHRFNKPARFLQRFKKHPYRSLEELFYAFHLEDLRSDILLWQHLAMSNGDNPYYEGEAREDLIDFCQALLKLAEALYVLHARRSEGRNRKKQAELTAEVIDRVNEQNQPRQLSEAEKANPWQVIDGFCQQFTHRYAKAEVLDMLEGAIVYKGDKPVHPVSLVTFYVTLKGIVGIAYLFHKNKKSTGDKTS